MYDIELRDLDSLLRKEIGNDLVVVSYHTERLLPPGENYGSTILKVTAAVKKTLNSEEKELHLVAKMLPETDFQRTAFNSSYTFKKEIFLYEKLLPAYRELELEFGECEPFDFAPKLVGARCSLISGSDVDEDAVILMEDLNVLGYRCMDKRKGLDLKHAMVALAGLAKFHGLGIAMKQKKPDEFKVIKHRAKSSPFTIDIDTPMKHFLRIFREDKFMSQYYESIEKAMSQEYDVIIYGPPPEPWATIIHSDFWINNIMFRNREEIKFVDFQNFLYLSPLRELVFCLMVNLKDDVMKTEFDHLLDFYYTSFIQVLIQLKCDVSQFDRDTFNRRLRIDAFQEFSHIPFLLKIMTTEIKDANKHNAEDTFMDSPINSLLDQKLRQMVFKYIEKGWLVQNED